jgi:hypothetical protein
MDCIITQQQQQRQLIAARSIAGFRPTRQKMTSHKCTTFIDVFFFYFLFNSLLCAPCGNDDEVECVLNSA